MLAKAITNVTCLYHFFGSNSVFAMYSLIKRDIMYIFIHLLLKIGELKPVRRTSWGFIYFKHFERVTLQ